ncbi:CAAX prenyl protease [Marasmius crinis-equi]|uniref:intramembrane prenyl-peptidase Rce1 n=1 Tax=Marasmius crinis-equi TaxID=585013 RepID=A0ABR3FL81_9AGAR
MPPVELAHLTSPQAYVLGLSLTFIYVGSLYVSKNARLSFSSKSSSTGGHRLREANERWRDDPDVIRARITAVTIATALCTLLVWIVVWRTVYGENSESVALAGKHALQLMGITSSHPFSWSITPSELWNNISPYLLAPLLFLGPLYAQFLVITHPKRTWSLSTHLRSTYMNIQGLRNCIIAPITEEVVFRACIVAVYHLGRISRNKMIWLGPLNFGVAHLHHAWDIYNRFGRTGRALKQAALTTLFQLGYTTLFGAFCTFVYLRTASLYPVVFAHAFCNVMGFPDFNGDARIGTQNNRGLVVKAAYLIGLVGFGFALSTWTQGSAQASLLWK